MNTLSIIKKIFTLIILTAGYISSVAQGKIIFNGGQMIMDSNVYVVTKDVSLTAPSNLQVNNSTLKIAGTIASVSNIDVQTGTVEMNGATSQIIPASSFTVNKIKNLIISNNVSLAGEDSITGVLSFGSVNSKTFSTGGYLTLKSSANGTAAVADLTNNLTNSGNQVLDKVHVERYLSAFKKWRFLSIPTSSIENIKAAWQEGCGTNANCLAGFGTQITGLAGTAGGFDAYSAAPSMKIYNTSTNGFDGVPNTSSTSIDSIINSTAAYMLFVRGDRDATSFSSPVTSTVLRTTGVIKQGTQAAVTIASPASAYTAVGNPYPSRIDLRKMTPAPTPATKIYVWDPLSTNGSLYGYGAFQTLTFDGSDFTVTPGGGSYGAPYNQNPNYIESGNAFFVGGNDSSYIINFKEDIKPSGSSLITTPLRMRQNFKADLYTIANGMTMLMDGAKADISIDYSAMLDNNDAYKKANSAENVSIKRNGKLLAVERYHSIVQNDTFFLNLGNVKVQNYQWNLTMQHLDKPGLNGYLKDNFLTTSTRLNLDGATTIDFSVANVPGSYAADRFYIYFAQAGLLPLSFTNVKAYLQQTSINVEWKVENENNLQQYAVEKSLNGTNYAKVFTVSAKNIAISTYNWPDEDAIPGYNYYRIKSIELSGKTEYSKVVKVFIPYEKKQISVYPNPVKDGIINLHLTNQLKGVYMVKILNAAGETVMMKLVEHAGGNSIQTLYLDRRIASGIYSVETSAQDGTKSVIKIVY